MSRKNIKGVITDTIGYTGVVTLSTRVRGKEVKLATIHNNGGWPLFDFLADCLVGNFDTAKIARPNRILLLNIDDSNSITKANDTGFIPLASVPEKVYNDAEGIVKYRFTIPQDYFVGTNFNAVGLYTGTATDADVENYAAFCYIGDKLSISDLKISSVLLLDWELHISN
jgi:hypothetical protein